MTKQQAQTPGGSQVCKSHTGVKAHPQKRRIAKPRYRICRILSLAWILVLYVTYFPVAAQTATLKGVVTDAETDETLVAANVEVNALDNDRSPIVMLTDSEGAFQIPNLPAGSYRLVVSYVGFEKYVLFVTLAPSFEKTLQIALIPRPFELDTLIVNSVSRRPEKAVDAPAAVSVVSPTDIRTKAALTPADYLPGLPAVDVFHSGLNQTSVAVRGFNSPLSGEEKLLLFQDYRNARVPSLRFNMFRFMPAPEDIDQIEVVSGPGSALYGPNASNGVIHVITKSPFDSKGTTVNLGVGERNLLVSSFRHAGSVNSQVGYRISGRYYQGRDWEYVDAAEPDSITKGTFTPAGRVDQGGKIPNHRDYDIQNANLDARLDFRPNPDFAAVLSGGYAKISNLDLTDFGTLQSKDGRYTYIQGRLTFRDLFAQVFSNWHDAGETFSLRTGDISIDHSNLIAGQIQHQLRFMENRQRFTYGVDAFLTRPKTEETISGRNEASDNIREIGFYLQSETELTPKLKLVAATRVDDHEHLSDRIFSPRAALVFKPGTNHTIRTTYNRAFTTPSSVVLFLDIRLGALHPLPYTLRGLGAGKDGYTFKRDANGGVDGLYMQSPFIPDAAGGPSAYLPAEATSMWPVVTALMQAQDVDLSDLPAPTSDQVGTSLQLLNTASQAFEPVSAADLTDIKSFEPSITNSFELGYKGVLGSKCYLTTDLYYNTVENFIAFNVQTPNVFFDSASLATYLEQFMPSENAAPLAADIAQIPLGTVTMQELGAQNPADLILTYRSFVGNVSFYGADFRFEYEANRSWRFGGTYSYVSKDLFQKGSKQPHDITLNGPRHKLGATIQYQNPAMGFDAQLHFRYVHDYPISIGVHQGRLDAYRVLDLNANWTLPFSSKTQLRLSVQNILDNMHQEFLGAPKIGRLGMVQLKQSF